MKRLAIAVLALTFVAGTPLVIDLVGSDDQGIAEASNGGFWSGGYKHQQEAREDTHYGFQCGSYQNNCFGYCGPGCAHTGAYTQACVNHDACVRDYTCAGYSQWSTHYYCLTGSRGMTKAAGSAISYHWNNAVHKVTDVVTGIWNWVQ